MEEKLFMKATLNFRNHTFIFENGIEVSFDFMHINVKPKPNRFIKETDIPRQEFNYFINSDEWKKLYLRGFKDLSYVLAGDYQS